MHKHTIFWTLLIIGVFFILAGVYKKYFLNRPTTVEIINHQIDLGIISSRDTAKAEFELVNTGSSILTVYDVETDCTCTTSNISNKQVPPGDTLTITLVYDKRFPGFFQKDAIVYANTPGPPLTLSFWGRVEQ